MISVIVPFYNAASFLEDCIQSILNQSYMDWELILIDDGSTDGSSRVGEQWIRQDRRLHIIHQENLGVTKARKNGVEKAKGEYICFVDADDMLLPDALLSYSERITPSVDIILSEAKSDKALSSEEYLEYCLLSRFQPLHGRLFQKDVLLQSKALDISRVLNIGEDIVGNIRMALSAKEIVTMTSNTYVYRKNIQSVTHTNKFSSVHVEM